MATIGSGRRARWGMLIISLALAVVLIADTGSSWRAARALSATLARGQGDIFLNAVASTLLSGAGGGPPASGALDEVLETWEARGLRAVALLDPEAEVIASAGQGTGAWTRPSPGLSHAPERVGERYRMAVPVPGPGRGPPDGPWLVIEFEPVLAQQMEARAARNFGIGLAAALVLALASAVLWRVSARADRVAEDLERQRLLASLGEMSAVLAHELRNPLASLKGHAQLLTEQLPEGRSRKKADRVVSEALRIERLIDTLLDYVRSGRVERRSVDPAALLRASAQAVAPERIELALEGAPARWSLDPTRMQQVLVNLLQNALQASPEGAGVSAGLWVAGDSLEWVIRDRGPGIPPEQLEAIFAPFFTTRTRGTGLGLAVCRQIVRAHGGEIHASNHPGGGAELRLTIGR